MYRFFIYCKANDKSLNLNHTKTNYRQIFPNKYNCLYICLLVPLYKFRDMLGVVVNSKHKQKVRKQQINKIIRITTYSILRLNPKINYEIGSESPNKGSTYQLQSDPSAHPPCTSIRSTASSVSIKVCCQHVHK